jgi:hypothetical protein
MHAAVPVEMDHLFNRARMAMTPMDWAAVTCAETQKMEISLARLKISKDVALLRAQYDVDIPISLATTLAQPEVYFNPLRPPNDHQVEFGIDKLIAPGDAVTQVKIQFVPVLMRIASLIGTPQLGLFSLATFHLRHLVRRDFPYLGCVTIVVAPLHPDTNAVLEEWGVMKAAVAILEPHEIPSKTKITEVKQLMRVPTWAVPRAAPIHFKHQLDCIKDYKESDAFKQVIEGEGKYIVIGIRRCTRGPPLLPRQDCNVDDITIASDWMQAEADGVRFALPEYLSTFLDRIGVKDVAIYDRLHGRQLVRYQAVVQCQAWERVWALLERPFRTQRAAYRSLHGGANAPDLTINMEPKFHAIDDSFAAISALGEIDSSIGNDMPTARTFIHFSAGMTRPHLGSDAADTFSEPLLAF